VDVVHHILPPPFLIVLLVERRLPVQRLEVALGRKEVIGRVLVEGDGEATPLLPEAGVGPDVSRLAVPHAAVGREGLAVPEELGEAIGGGSGGGGVGVHAEPPVWCEWCI